MLGTALAEVAAVSGTRADCEALYDILEPQRGRIVTNGYGVSCFGPVAHYLGLLSGALGRRERMDRDFELAIASSERLRSPRWRIESLLAHASLLADAPDPGLRDRERAVGLERAAVELCEPIDAFSLKGRAYALRDLLERT